MQYNSTVFKYLDSKTIFELNQELSVNKDNPLWGAHISNNSYMKFGQLRHGKTMWLECVSLSLMHSSRNLEYFPKSFEIIKELSGINDYGRCYWHTLPPGAVIERHRDVDSSHSYFDFVENRYQIYLDIPDEAIVVIDDTLQDPSKFRNCILDFNMTRPHYYKNNSKRDFTFAVIDILKPGLKVTNRPVIL
jgi:hypothetical protein